MVICTLQLLSAIATCDDHLYTAIAVCRFYLEWPCLVTIMAMCHGHLCFIAPFWHGPLVMVIGNQLSSAVVICSSHCICLLQWLSAATVCHLKMITTPSAVVICIICLQPPPAVTRCICCLPCPSRAVVLNSATTIMPLPPEMGRPSTHMAVGRFLASGCGSYSTSHVTKAMTFCV